MPLAQTPKTPHPALSTPVLHAPQHLTSPLDKYSQIGYTPQHSTKTPPRSVKVEFRPALPPVVAEISRTPLATAPDRSRHGSQGQSGRWPYASPRPFPPNPLRAEPGRKAEPSPSHSQKGSKPPRPHQKGRNAGLNTSPRNPKAIRRFRLRPPPHAQSTHQPKYSNTRHPGLEPGSRFNFPHTMAWPNNHSLPLRRSRPKKPNFAPKPAQADHTQRRQCRGARVANRFSLGKSPRQTPLAPTPSPLNPNQKGRSPNSPAPSNPNKSHQSLLGLFGLQSRHPRLQLLNLAQGFNRHILDRFKLLARDEV